MGVDDARTKLDIIYQDVMGEFNALLDRTEALKNDLPASLAPVVDNLRFSVVKLREGSAHLVELHTQALERSSQAAQDKLAAAASQVQHDLTALTVRIEKNLSSTVGILAAKGIEQALQSQDIKKPFTEAINALTTAHNNIVRETTYLAEASKTVTENAAGLASKVTSEAAKFNGQVERFGRALEGEAKRLGQALAEQAVWPVWKRLGAQLGVAVAAGVVLLLLAKVIGLGGMTEAQFAQLRADQQITVERAVNDALSHKK